MKFILKLLLAPLMLVLWIVEWALTLALKASAVVCVIASALFLLSGFFYFVEGNVKNGCICVAEGANMPSTPDAIRIFQQHKLLYAPGKAANAGGVATSGLEMSQNSMRLHWSPEEVDAKLRAIMQNIHEVCVKYGTEPDGYVNYVKGANIGGFMKVANAMLAQGCC